MKHLLAVLMLLIVAVTLYSAIMGGEGGMGATIRDAGGQVSQTIERINP